MLTVGHITKDHYFRRNLYDFGFSSILSDHVQIKRRDFIFAELISSSSKNEHDPALRERVFLPVETHGYPPIHFLRTVEKLA